MSESSPLDRLIRVIPDWPEVGVQFQDLTGVIAHPDGLAWIGLKLAEPFAGAGITHVAGMEARGFIVGSVVARELNTGFVALRKAGKLPGLTHSVSYDLEYGSASLEVHQADLGPDARVLVIDDVLATGGTAQAAAELVTKSGAELVGFGFVLELSFLSGAAKLGEVPVHSLKVIS